MNGIGVDNQFLIGLIMGSPKFLYNDRHLTSINSTHMIYPSIKYYYCINKCFQREINISVHACFQIFGKLSFRHVMMSCLVGSRVQQRDGITL